MSGPWWQSDDGRVALWHGDCRTVMAAMEPESVEAIVTDPPYGLEFMGVGWDTLRDDGKARSPTGFDVLHSQEHPREASEQAYIRGKKNRAAQEWHHAWAVAALRVLKPGAHLVAFGGTRTHHRLWCALEDAGFEIRDTLMWLTGQGFPKSLDVSKAIDKAAPRVGMFAAFARHYEERRKATELTHAAICEAGRFYDDVNHGGASVNWEKGHNVPTLAQWAILQPLLGLSDDWLPLVQRLTAEREIIGKDRNWGDRGTVPVSAYGEFDITAPATAAARQWDGWGTALKPAVEFIVLCRKPLSERNVATNVLKHGTGALNIEACRLAGQRPIIEAWEDDAILCGSCAANAGSNAKPIARARRESTARNDVAPTTNARGRTPRTDTSKTDTGCSAGPSPAEPGADLRGDSNSSIGGSGKTHMVQSPPEALFITSTETDSTTASKTCASCGVVITGRSTPPNTLPTLNGRPSTPAANASRGRWPSNVVLSHTPDCNDTCVPGCPAAMLDAQSGSRAAGGSARAGQHADFGYHGGMDNRNEWAGYNDSGGASRFFYCAKADSAERRGTKHPTVKPLDLMKWLVTLITPPGGLVLDPFCGSGTTLEAAHHVAFRAIGIDTEAEYLEDAKRRLAQGVLPLGG